MPSWQSILTELNHTASPIDSVRRKYLQQFAKMRDRNVIAYYSGWLQGNARGDVSINDEDMEGFMNAVHTCNRKKGLDLILHTPGGGITATAAIVRYLRKSFQLDIECFVPQLAMSAGTMMACACNQIHMGEHSSLGPIDPQFNGISTHGVLEEFQKAIEEVKKDPKVLPMYRLLIEKYHPTFLGDCEKAITLSSEFVGEWLKTGMFRNDENKDEIVAHILDKLNNHSETKQHDRHLDIDYIKSIGLRVAKLEEEPLQDATLSVHHAFILTFSQTSATKIIESASGSCFIKTSH